MPGLAASPQAFVVQRLAAPGAPNPAEAPSPQAPSPAEAPSPQAPSPAEAAPQSTVVVDDNQPAGPGQITRSQFLARVQAGARAATDEELAGTGRTAADCPYLEYWFGVYSGQNASRLERTVRRFASPGADTPEAWVAAVVARVRSAVRAWRVGGTEDGRSDANVPGPANDTGAPVQPKRDDGASAGPANPAAVLAQLGPGKPFEGAAKGRMEQGFGERFDHVRIHDDTDAGALANRLSARAFTVGPHVAFAPGQLQPGTFDGDAVLAHELAHVLQQQRWGAGVQMRQAVAGPSWDEAEPAADRAAAGVLARLYGGESLRPEDLRAETPRPPTPGLRLQRCQPSAPSATDVAALTRDLQDAIRDGTWRPAIRTRMVAQLAPPLERAADERRAGRQPDLRGLGAVASLDRIAAGIAALQRDWTAPGMTPDARRGRIVSVVNAELTAAGVPPFRSHSTVDMLAQASFNRGRWSFQIRRQLVTTAPLSNDDAAEIADKSTHEARHAEQAFLAARYRAGQGQTAAQIEAEFNMPMPVATAAAASPLGAADPNFALAEEMYRATVINRDANMDITHQHDIEVAELDRRRAAAEGALRDLQRDPSRSHYDAGVQARDRLRAQITVVERAYVAYRNIPSERDAHEVGASAGRAFQRRPP